MMKHYTLRLLSRLGLHLAVSFPFVSQYILLAFDPIAMQMTDPVQIHNIKLELVRMVIFGIFLLSCPLRVVLSHQKSLE